MLPMLLLLTTTISISITTTITLTTITVVMMKMAFAVEKASLYHCSNKCIALDYTWQKSQIAKQRKAIKIRPAVIDYQH